MKIKIFAKIRNHQSISGRKKYFSIRFAIGLVAMFSVVFLANAQGVALPTNVGLPSGTLTSVIANFTNWILGIFGFLAIISFVVSGIMYLLSAGDDKAQEKAKKQMTWSITGVVIGLIGLVVIYTVNMLLGGGSGFFGSSSVINSASNSPMTGASVPAALTPTNPIDPKTGNRIFIDQQGRKFELIDGKLTPMNEPKGNYNPANGAYTNSGPDSSYQP